MQEFVPDGHEGIANSHLGAKFVEQTRRHAESDKPVAADPPTPQPRLADPRRSRPVLVVDPDDSLEQRQAKQDRVADYDAAYHAGWDACLVSQDSFLDGIREEARLEVREELGAELKAAEQIKIKSEEMRLYAARWRVEAEKNREEWESEFRQRNVVKSSTAAAPKPKQRNRVIFDVVAYIVPDAAGTRDAMLRRYSSGDFIVSECHADGQVLMMEIDYTVKGGHPADVHRAHGRALRDVGAEVMGPATKGPDAGWPVAEVRQVSRVAV